jgi:hypothetical protein
MLEKFYKTRLATIIITSIVCMGLFSGIAFASGTFNSNTIDATVNVFGITSANPNLVIYTDATYNTKVNNIDFGYLPSGGTIAYPVFIKNIGDTTFNTISVVSNFPVGTINISPTTQLQSGTSRMMIITCTINQNVVPNSYPFKITIVGNY